MHVYRKTSQEYANADQSHRGLMEFGAENKDIKRSQTLLINNRAI